MFYKSFKVFQKKFTLHESSFKRIVLFNLELNFRGRIRDTEEQLIQIEDIPRFQNLLKTDPRIYAFHFLIKYSFTFSIENIIEFLHLFGEAELFKNYGTVFERFTLPSIFHSFLSNALSEKQISKLPKYFGELFKNGLTRVSLLKGIKNSGPIYVPGFNIKKVLDVYQANNDKYVNAVITIMLWKMERKSDFYFENRISENVSSFPEIANLLNAVDENELYIRLAKDVELKPFFSF